MRTKQLIKKIADTEVQLKRTDLSDKERSDLRLKLQTLNKRLERQQGK